MSILKFDEFKRKNNNLREEIETDTDLDLDDSDLDSDVEINDDYYNNIDDNDTSYLDQEPQLATSSEIEEITNDAEYNNININNNNIQDSIENIANLIENEFNAEVTCADEYCIIQSEDGWELHVDAMIDKNELKLTFLVHGRQKSTTNVSLSFLHKPQFIKNELNTLIKKYC